MSITVQHQGSVCRVAILGRLEMSNDKTELKSLLSEDADTLAGDKTLELNFYDAETLSADLIEALSERLSRGDNLKIVAYNALLAHSLLRLDLPVRQVVNRMQRTAPTHYRALALAGSANSLDKILYIVKHLPLSSTPIFILQHLQEDKPNFLDQLLKEITEYRVVVPQNLMPVQDGTLYVAPAGYHMKVVLGLIHLTRDPLVQFSRPSIDVLFESLAAEYGGSVLAALLCGYGQDGVAGCAGLRASGSLVLVEDGAECEQAHVMPDSAYAAGHYDHVMKFMAIASVSAAAISGKDARPAGPLLEAFLESLLNQYGSDFRGYQRDSLERRIKNMITLFGQDSFAEFQCAVLSNAILFERLCAELSVGVTMFFRHPEQLRLIREEVFPYLESFPIVKVWSAGCSTGEEAYSLAIILEESGLLERTHLFATDTNRYLLELAKSGLFPLGSLKKNRENYLVSGGPRLFDAYVLPVGPFLKVEERLRQRILFHRHSLANEDGFNEFQLIVCRNVMIYFNTELQRLVLQRFAHSLHADGFLVLGPQDSMNFMALEEGFVPYKSGSHIYRYRGKRNNA